MVSSPAFRIPASEKRSTSTPVTPVCGGLVVLIVRLKGLLAGLTASPSMAVPPPGSALTCTNSSWLTALSPSSAYQVRSPCGGLLILTWESVTVVVGVPLPDSPSRPSYRSMRRCGSASCLYTSTIANDALLVSPFMINASRPETAYSPVRAPSCPVTSARHSSMS